jgi:hypothetical protein
VERGAWSVERGAWSVERGAWSVMLLQARSEPVGTSNKYRMIGWVHIGQRGWILYHTDISASTVGVAATEFHVSFHAIV